MSRFLRYEPCEKCRERGKDSRGDNLATYSDGGGHCFSCGYHRHPASSLRWASKVPDELDNKIKRILPDDFTWDVPARCWEWLLQYGLSYDYWKGIVGWSEKYQRMVFRIGTPLRCSLGRSFSGLDQQRKWHVWGDVHQSVEAIGESRTITMVEDWLSANKVAQVSQTLCLFGTRIYPIHLEYLRQQGKPINIWLDNDQGDIVMNKAANLNMLTGLPVNIINSQKDPKDYGLKEIAEYLSGSSS